MRAPIRLERYNFIAILFPTKKGAPAARLRCKKFAACFDTLGFKPFFRRKKNEWQSQLFKMVVRTMSSDTFFE